jgi:hypothetical protein
MNAVADIPGRRWRLNCFALAELLLGKPFERRGAALIEALREALREDFEPIYTDDQTRTTLVDALGELGAMAVRAPTIDAALALLPEPLRAAALKFPPDMLERALMAFISPLAGPGQGHGRRPPAALRYAAKPRIVGERLDFLDPVQGNIPDCGLISALIASAFVDPDALRQRLIDSGLNAQRPAHALPFFAKNRPPAVLVQAEFPVTPADQPVYARSSEVGEGWPALIEKAYAMWFAVPVISWIPAAPDIDNIDAATYQGIGHQFPRDVLEHLWGGDAEKDTSNRFFGRLVGEQARPPLVHAQTRVALRAVIAWTYPTAVETGIQRAYATSVTGITRNHAYAVLGVAQLKDGRGRTGDFVVLRDPHGEQRDLPPPAVVAKYGAGVWKADGLPDGLREVELNANGVLALPQRMFDELFQGIAWSG